MFGMAAAMVVQATISNIHHAQEQARHYGSPIPLDHPWVVERHRQAEADYESARRQAAAFRDQMLAGYAAAIAMSPEPEPVRRKAAENLGRMWREWRV